MAESLASAPAEALDETVLDFGRADRIGLEEAIFCEGKSADQIAVILDQAAARGARFLLTRLSQEKFERLACDQRGLIDYCTASRTGFFGGSAALSPRVQVAVVAAGTSDASVAREAARTLRYHGQGAELILDVGVAGLWRLTRRLDDIRRHPITIVVAGMDAALASVLGGLVSGPIIAVPTSVGYGVAMGGGTALNAILASCAPGVAAVNIDNGYGAACIALRLLNVMGASSSHRRQDQTGTDDACDQ
jgi:NCAIR mutase (PurE)-related protein